MKTMPREKLKVVTTQPEAAEQARYTLDEQVGFLMRVARPHREEGLSVAPDR